MTAKFPYRPANKFHEGIKARFEAVDETSQSIKLLTGAVRKVADAVQSLGMRDKDNVTALYAAAVDTTGDIVDRTNAGQWLNSAKFKKLRDLVKFRKDEPQAIRRQDFVDKMRAAPRSQQAFPQSSPTMTWRASSSWRQLSRKRSTTANQRPAANCRSATSSSHQRKNLESMSRQFEQDEV